MFTELLTIWLPFLTNDSSVGSLRTTVVAVAAFLDAFQKVADLATNSRGKIYRKHTVF